MRAAFEIADVVGEGADVLGVAVVVLQGDADLGVFEAAVDADHVGEQGIFRAVQVFDELDDAVLVLELVRLAAALVGNQDPCAGGEEGELLQPLVEDVVAEFRVGENLRIGPEGNLGAGAFALAELLEPAHHGAAGEVHGPDVAFAADLGLEPFGKRVDRRDADAVQSAGPRFVAAGAVEFSAGVDFGEDDFEGRAVVHIGHGSDGDAAAVVGDGNAAVGVEADDDHAGKAVDRLVDAVIDDFVNEVVQAARGRVPDIHRGPFADALDPFEDADIAGVVAGIVMGLPQFFGRPGGGLFVFRCFVQFPRLQPANPRAGFLSGQISGRGV